MEVTYSVKRSPVEVNWSHSHHKTIQLAQFGATSSTRIEAITLQKTTYSANIKAIHDWHGYQHIVLYLTTSKCGIKEKLNPTYTLVCNNHSYTALHTQSTSCTYSFNTTPTTITETGPTVAPRELITSVACEITSVSLITHSSGVNETIKTQHFKTNWWSQCNTLVVYTKTRRYIKYSIVIPPWR